MEYLARVMERSSDSRYIAMDALADLLITTSSMQKVGGKAKFLWDMKVTKLYELVQGTFSDEKKLKEK